MASTVLGKPKVSMSKAKSPEEKALIKKMQATEMIQRMRNYPQQALAPFLLSN